MPPSPSTTFLQGSNTSTAITHAVRSISIKLLSLFERAKAYPESLEKRVLLIARALLSWVLLASLWWAFELGLLNVDYPKSIFNHFFETFVKSPDATWALLSHTSGLVVFLIIVNAPSKRRWLVFILLCGVCFLWGLKSLGVPETAWASTTNAAGYTLMLIAAITCLGLSFIGGSVVATRHVLGLLKRSVMRGADQQMIDDVMQSPLLNVVISRHMRELSKDACCSGDVNGGSYSGEYHGEGQSLNEKVSQASPIAASHQQQQQQQQQRHQSIVCSSSPCPSCISLVQQLRRQVAELQAAAASTSSAHAQQRSIFMHPPASCSLPPPLNSSHMTIRCIDGRTVQVHLQDYVAPRGGSLHAACQTDARAPHNVDATS